MCVGQEHSESDGPWKVGPHASAIRVNFLRDYSAEPASVPAPPSEEKLDLVAEALRRGITLEELEEERDWEDYVRENS